ncbi:MULTISPECIES: hypothetical protein [unclassified Kitasatospora]|uniref:hypothetical protein n=1 Tax=unclassified Kitasatospora TaxID=2633591 RepID=UPI000710A532|nr:MULTISPECIES: hypothetical protein [unclassified Kitasatospora]KQV20910.1 hypothetical protein ASC99_20620 [Kitasatospora sp. Root107]KRB60437.1 hypothetical protein ASE03_12565 [Kitasatospora sp. Root187]
MEAPVPRPPNPEAGAALDIYPYGREAAREVLHDAHLLAGRVPVLDALDASADQHSRSGPDLASVVAADAAFLLAHAADHGIEHALDGRLPQTLVALDRASARHRDAVFAAAKRAADPTPTLGTRSRSPAARPGIPRPSGSWLRDEQLRELLGAVVHSSLQLSEKRYTGRDEHEQWIPGGRTLPEALRNVSAEMCRAADLDPGWTPFVEVQVAHAVARANELPHGAGPLDDRIPAYMTHLARLEPITQADTLAIAALDFRYRHPASDPASLEHPDARSTRALSALLSTARRSPLPATATGLPARTRTAPDPARKAR